MTYKVFKVIQEVKGIRELTIFAESLEDAKNGRFDEVFGSETNIKESKIIEVYECP